MLHKKLLITVAFLVISQSLWAKGNFNSPDSELIINSCKEVVEIYKNRDEKRFMASQTTSLSESLRAGYCIGMLVNTKCQRAYKSNWMVAAKRIAELDPNLAENKQASLEDVLAHGACVR